VVFGPVRAVEHGPTTTTWRLELPGYVGFWLPTEISLLGIPEQEHDVFAVTGVMCHQAPWCTLGLFRTSADSLIP